MDRLLRGFQATNHVGLNYYYRTKSGSELDFIIEGDFGTLPIEIKYGSSTSLKQLVGLSKFKKDHRLPLGIVINNSDEIEMFSENIVQIPSRFI